VDRDDDPGRDRRDGAGRPAFTGPGPPASIEDADAERADQEADDDEHDAPQELSTEQREDAGDDEDHCEDPKE
jgi:hypothetical protein